MKFRCLVSGTIIEFTEAHDIRAMLDHHQYEPVDEVPENLPESSVHFKAPVSKKGKK